jgi:protein-tyrosine phosphatase
MIDLHCHLVPGIDDGPATLEESLAMARLAVAGGISAARTTPHIHVGRWDNDLAKIAAAVAALRAEIERAAIPLELSYAAEVRLDYDILPMIEEGRVPFLGTVDGQRVLLLEFPHSHVPVGADKFVAWLLRHNIRPMIAHPERNKELMVNPARLLPFVNEGCLLQLTADALAGEFGELARKRSVEFLEHGWVTVIASDAHDTVNRPPRMAAGRDAAAKVVGAEAADQLVQMMPGRILGIA